MTPATDHPTLCVLLGAAGDPVRRLVVPALFEPCRGGVVPPRFRLFGLDRADLETRTPVGRWCEGCVRFGRGGQPADEPRDRFVQDLVYQRVVLSDPDAYRAPPQPVLDAWRYHPAVDFPDYPAGGWGPESAEGLISRDGRSWPAPTPPGGRP